MSHFQRHTPRQIIKTLVPMFKLHSLVQMLTWQKKKLNHLPPRRLLRPYRRRRRRNLRRCTLRLLRLLFLRLRRRRRLRLRLLRFLLILRLYQRGRRGPKGIQSTPEILLHHSQPKCL